MARAEGLGHLLGKKLDLLQSLLLSESDKLHYQKSGNLDRVMELTRADARTIDAINLVDFDIARAEDELCAIIGVGKPALYETLGTGEVAHGLAQTRKRIRRSVEELLRMRDILTGLLDADAREIGKSIAALSRIDALRIPGDGDD